jgi:hypothetical protein
LYLTFHLNEKFTYVAYGLRLACDRPIAGLIAMESETQIRPDITVRFRSEGQEIAVESMAPEALWYTSEILDNDGKSALQIWKEIPGGDYRIRYSHGLEFRVDATASSIFVNADEKSTPEEIAEFLLGPVMGIVLRLRGCTCLHASAVDLDGQAVAFVGNEGAGKSTTAAWFAQKGHAVLCDDILALVERESSIAALPAYPCLNLWRDAMDALSGSRAIPSTFAQGGEKFRIRLAEKGSRFQSEALPLKAIFLLGERSSCAESPRVEQASPQETLMGLVGGTYANKLPDSAIRANEFRFLGRMANQVPCFRVSAPEGIGRMDSVYEIICSAANFSAAESPHAREAAAGKL